ncbi:Cytochrome c' [Magnetospirillum sp. LM-5]|uniref:cytochrome c n=1 Tax=Magnetospirillum sp. LM-5 TaxID=2681466 RepID=UPI00137FDA32|nr:cytochrome c [Magnetospirillum sp. LM-5]CAA7624016.1 Cytochrome c' [Magnetospirillum sp. LM-5]
MRYFIGSSVIIATLAIAAAQPASAQQKPEEALKMRQGLMQAVRMNFGPIGAWLQGKGDLPADAAAKAENVAAIAKMAPMAWAKGTESLSGANTKSEAFGSADFAKGWVMLGEAAVKLQAAAASGNADATKMAAADVGKTCKGCHDNFRKE